MIKCRGDAFAFDPYCFRLSFCEAAVGDLLSNIIMVLPLPVAVSNDDVESVIDGVEVGFATTIGRFKVDVPVIDLSVAEEGPDGVGVVRPVQLQYTASGPPILV